MTVARASGPLGELVLSRRIPTLHGGADGTDDGARAVWELRANGVFVMDTTHTETEVALAAAALASAASPARVLVGGLGLGFTLRAVLTDPRVDRVVVAEIEPALVGWFRDGTVPLGDLLTDPRVEVVVDDVAAVIARAGEASRTERGGVAGGPAYDLVLLDVDNGPGYLVHEANAALYRRDFLRSCRAALVDGGALVIWSAATAPELAAVLSEVVGPVQETPLDVRLGQRDEVYYLYTARRHSTLREPPA